MHPVIRILCLFVIVACLPFLSAPAVFAAAAAVVLSLPVLDAAVRRAVFAGIWRLRWLLLAILVLYLLFDGTPHAAEAFARMLVLCLAVSAVQFTLHGLAPGALAGGLSRVLAPLRTLGLDPAAFARRLVLTLDAVPRVQALIAEHAAGSPARRAAAVIQRIEQDPPAIAAIGQDDHDPGPVPRIQWAWPTLVACLAVASLWAGGAR